MFYISVSKTIASPMAAQAASSSEKNGIWSLINKCVFCRSLSDGRHKLLQCLHIVCKTCIDVKMTKTGKYVFKYFSIKLCD